MSIEDDLRQRLTAAIKARDMPTANTIRMVNTKVMERRTAKGFSGQVDDALYLDVIGAYKKTLEKACGEFENGGEKGQAAIAEMQIEINFLKQFLPSELSEDEVRAAVKQVIAELSVTDPKMANRVMGQVMKVHKGRVDAETVKKIIGEELK